MGVRSFGRDMPADWPLEPGLTYLNHEQSVSLPAAFSRCSGLSEMPSSASRVGIVGPRQGFTAEFDVPGTRDSSAHLSTPAAIALLQELGVDAVQSYNHALAWAGARHLAEVWQVDLQTPEALIGTMATVAMPKRLGATAEEAARVRDALLFEDHIEVQVHAFRDRLHVRIAAHVYNDPDDTDRLANAVARRT